MIDLLGDSNDALDNFETSLDLDGLTERDDPFSVIGDALGSAPYCDEATGDVVQDNVITETYSCFDTFETTTTSDSCSVPLDVDVDVDYEYSCSETNEDVCTGTREYYETWEGQVYVDYGDYDQSDTPLIDFKRHLEQNLPSGCWVDINENEFYEDNEVPVIYFCDFEVEAGAADFAYDFVLLQHFDCENGDTGSSGSTCEAFDGNPNCVEAGEEYCETEGGSVFESVSCVPGGQSVEGLECKRERVHELEVIFSYDCQYIYDDESGELLPDPKCADLLDDESCSPGGDECVENADMEFEDFDCQVGESLTYEDVDCVAERYGLGLQEFLYKGYEIFDVGSASFSDDSAKVLLDGDSSCREDGRTCVVEAPELSEEEVCLEGYELVDTSYTCELQRVVEVDEDYIYGTRRGWNEASMTHVALDNDRAILEESCISQGETCEVETPPSYEQHTCLQGYRFNQSTETCELAREIVVDTDYGYVGKEVYNEVVVDARLGGPSDQWSESVFDLSGWSQDVNGDHLGQRGQVTGWPVTYSSETTFTRTQGPNGASVVSVLAGQTNTTNGGGGALSSEVSVDPTKGYEFSIYFKLDETDKHRVYFGLGRDVVKQGWTGNDNNNPYFAYPVPAASAGFEADVWYKIVGYVLPVGHAVESKRYGGVYDTRDGSRIGGPAFHYIWRNASVDSTWLRYFNHYGVENQGQFTHFYNPELREINIGAVIGPDDNLSYNANADGHTSGFVKDAAFDAAENASCDTLSRECTLAYETQYENLTCLDGYDYDDELVTIERQRVIDYDIDYLYKGYSNYVTNTGFVDTAELDTLQATSTCSLTNEVCTIPGDGVFSTYTCREGYTEIFNEFECDVPLLVSTDSDYVYQASETFNIDRYLPESELIALRNSNVCTMQDRFCTVDSPGVFEAYACNVGYERTYENKSFRRLGQAVFDTDYYYEGTRTWEGVKSAKLIALENDSECAFEGTVCSQETAPSYSYHTCRQGYQDNKSNMTCQRNRIIEVDEDYTYTVDRVWSVSQNTWTGASDWNRARSSTATAAQCVKQSEICSSDSPGVFSEHSCQQGYRIDDGSRTCNKELNFTTETDYRYTAYENWNGSSYVKDTTLTKINQQKNTKSCTRNSVTNEVPLTTAQRTSKYQCLQGSITYSDSSTCEPVLELDWYWKKYWIMYAFSGDDDPSIMEGTCTYLYSQSVEEDYDEEWYRCPEGYNEAGQYSHDQHIRTTKTTWNYSSCQSQINAGLTQTGEICIEGASTKSINASGQTLTHYETCWKKRRTYGTSVTKTVNSCSPPSGFAYKRQTTYTGSPALGTSRNLKKREYEKVESLANAGNIVSDYVCLTGYWKPSSGANKNYSCSPPSGSSMKSNICAWNDAAGTCRLYARSYTVPNPGPTAGYNRHKEVWTCDQQVTGSGVSSPQLLRTRKAWTFGALTCNVPVSNFNQGCTLTSSAYVGPSTAKTVDGLTITRQWDYQYNYSCKNRVDINTCAPLLAFNESGESATDFASVDSPVDLSKVTKYASLELGDKFKALNNVASPFSPETSFGSSGIGSQSPPPVQYAAVGDWTFEGQTCINYEGSTCTLWEKDYSREENDASGGCHVQEEVYKCENAVSGMGTATITRDIVSDKWEWPSADCQAKLAQHDSCRYLGQAYDMSTAATKVINGKSVYKSTWVLDRNYECTDRVETNTCAPPSGSVVDDVTCVWSDSNGVCRLSDYVYSKLLPDPTDGCSEYTDTYLCERRTHGAQVGTYKHFSRLTYPTSAENLAARSDPQCVRLAGGYGGGRATRIIDGIESTPVGVQQWHYDENFRCHEDEQIDTCNVPDNSTLVSEVCLSELITGECSLYRENYSVELPDPSGGCLEWTEEYLCESQVANAGSPIAVPVEESGSERDLSQCASLINEFPVISGSGKASVHNFDFDNPVESSWIKIQNNTYLHLGEVNIWGRDSGGTLRNITSRHRDGLVASQGSTHYAGRFPADSAVDGNTGTFNHTSAGSSAWLKISFPAGYKLTRVQLVNRHNYDGGRLNGSVVSYEKNGSLCEPLAQTCIEGAETRLINGAQITKSCWKWEYSYECANRTDVNTCEPEETAVLDDQTCEFTDRDGNCTLSEYVYLNEEHDPSGGCDQKEFTYECADQVSGLTHFDTDVAITREYWDVQPYYDMTAEWQRCTYVAGSVTVDPAEVRDYGPLTLNRRWAAQWTYDCYNRELVNTCDFAEGSTLVSETCADEYNGACVLEEHTYSVPIPNQANGCAEYSTNFKCENELSDEFVTYTEFKEVESEKYNQDACIALENSFEACRRTNVTCVEPGETRVIDGMTLTRSCWKQEYEYECDTKEEFDTCVIPPEAKNVEANCVWSDVTGTCRLFENTYDILLPDPTGGCTTYVEPFRCEESIAGLPVMDTIKHVEREYFDSSDCEREDDNSVCSASHECSEGAETRTIDGLEVTRSCWAQERSNSCLRRDDYDECRPFAEYGEPVSECAWEDDNDVCRLFSNTYSIPVDDGSGGCHSWENTYWCGSEIADLDHEEHVISVSSTLYDNDACNTISQQEGAHRTGETCTDPSNGPRAPPIVRHRESNIEFVISEDTVVEAVDAECWSETRDFIIETATVVNTCTGQVINTCALENSSCAQTSQITGNCSLQDLSYSCEIEGSDYCEVQENTFNCVGPATASSSQLTNLNGGLAQYEPSEITANVVRTYFDNSACSQATAFGSCTVVSTQCSDRSEGVPRGVERAQDDYFQQFVGYAPDQLETCWEQTRTWDCGIPDDIQYCDSSVDSCELSSTNCIHEDDNGACLMNVNSYSCDTGAQGECSETGQDYVCDEPVEGETATGITNTEVTSEYDLSECVEADNESTFCEEPESVCVQPGEVRDIEVGEEGQTFTVPVEADCWEYENTYQCTEVGDQYNDCAPEENCELSGSTCLSEDLDGNCTTTEYTYECTSIETQVLQEGTQGTCEEGDIVRDAPNAPNTSTGPLAALLGVAQADRETGQSEGFNIFEGTHKTCRRNIAGTLNCCQNSGILLGIGLASCKDSERELAVQKEENRCVDVGRYCSNKVFPGICTKRKTSYCCFEAEIGRIIAEAGRSQLGRDWGSAKNPDCGGFSVQEFQQLDLDQVDFSSVSSDLMNSLSGQDLSQYENDFGNQMDNLLNGGQ